MYSVVLIGLSSIAQDYFVCFFINLIIKKIKLNNFLVSKFKDFFFEVNI